MGPDRLDRFRKIKMPQNKYRRALEDAFRALGQPAKWEYSEIGRLSKTLALIDRQAGGIVGKKILELGSSVGVQLVAMSKLGAGECAGLDKFVFPETHESPFRVTSDQLVELKKTWEANRVRILPHDLGDRFPFADGAFDIVTCNAVIEHTAGIHRHLFSEARRVLRPGGHFIFTTPNLAMLLKRLRFIFGRSPLWDLKDYFKTGPQFTGHVREFTVKECRQMLEWSGFEAVAVHSRPTYFFWHWLKMPRIWHRVLLQGVSFLSPNWGDLIFAVGRKPRAERNVYQEYGG